MGQNQPVLAYYCFLTALLPPLLALQCQDFPVPTKAQVNCSHPFGTFRYQSVCSFSCEEGSLLVGASALQCLATGRWSAIPPECQGKCAFFPISWK
jgi:podocalyxin-like protein 2